MNVLRSGPNSSVSFILIPLLPVKLMVSNMNLNVVNIRFKICQFGKFSGLSMHNQQETKLQQIDYMDQYKK
jgi:hypothetical protein